MASRSGSIAPISHVSRSAPQPASGRIQRPAGGADAAPGAGLDSSTTDGFDGAPSSEAGGGDSAASNGTDRRSRDRGNDSAAGLVTSLRGWANPSAGGETGSARAQKLEALGGQVGDSLGSREGQDKLNGLLQKGEGVFSKENLAALKEKLPDMSSLHEQFPELKNLSSLSREQVQKLHDNLGQKLRDFKTLSDVHGKIAGQDGVLNRGDLHPTVDNLMGHADMQRKVSQLSHRAADSLQGHRLDGSQRRDGPLGRLAGGVMSNLGNRYVGNHQGEIQAMARAGVHQNAEKSANRMGLQAVPNDKGRHELSLSDLEAANRAGRDLLGKEQKTVSQTIDEKFAQQLSRGGIMGIKKHGMQMPTPTRDEALQQAHGEIQRAVDGKLSGHDAARGAATEALTHAFDALLNNALDHGVTAEDIYRPWRSAASLYKVTGNLLENWNP